MATQLSDAAKRLRRRNAVIALAVVAVFILALPAFCLLKSPDFRSFVSGKLGVPEFWGIPLRAALFS